MASINVTSVASLKEEVLDQINKANTLASCFRKAIWIYTIQINSTYIAETDEAQEEPNDFWKSVK